MAERRDDTRLAERRDVLRASAAAVTGLTLSGTLRAEEKPAASLPSIPLGPHRISRLVAGWNPIGGHSHATLNLSRCMLEYFTVENTAEFLLRCEREGITAWQYDHTDKSVAALRLAREKGSRLKVICLHAERRIDAPIRKVIDDTHPIAIVHHGSVTDAMFRSGQQAKVRDFVKKVKDAGLLAGVSTHAPDHVKQVANEAWENDFFMTCFYYVTRPKDDQQKTGRVVEGEPFFQSDPKEMTKVIREVKKPCLAFKILGAGRLASHQVNVDRAFKFALANIKPTDAVIVGMFPRYADEIHEDAELVRKYGAV